jgi:uncharacterized protein YjbJ (UPF0337 family)
LEIGVVCVTVRVFTMECSAAGNPAGGSTGRYSLGLDDKIENAGDKLTGKAKEGAGAATDDDSLRAEGQADQGKADLKQAGEKVKDAFKHD